MSTAKVIEVIGNSNESWEKAAENALKDASKSIRNISGAEIKSQTADVKDGEIVDYKVAVKLAFRYDSH
ncbi:MAG: dodecin family protein [Candidatus Thermoplasmatota archaeon]|nr:dodecin family protein [Candidatus Thermoplasmatota archaeon]